MSTGPIEPRANPSAAYIDSDTLREAFGTFTVPPPHARDREFQQGSVVYTQSNPSNPSNQGQQVLPNKGPTPMPASGSYQPLNGDIAPNAALPNNVLPFPQPSASMAPRNFATPHPTTQQTSQPSVLQPSASQTFASQNYPAPTHAPQLPVPPLQQGPLPVPGTLSSNASQPIEAIQPPSSSVHPFARRNALMLMEIILSNNGMTMENLFIGPIVDSILSQPSIVASSNANLRLVDILKSYQDVLAQGAPSSGQATSNLHGPRLAHDSRSNHHSQNTTLAAQSGVVAPRGTSFDIMPATNSTSSDSIRTGVPANRHRTHGDVSRSGRQHTTDGFLQEGAANSASNSPPLSNTGNSRSDGLDASAPQSPIPAAARPAPTTPGPESLHSLGGLDSLSEAADISRRLMQTGRSPMPSGPDPSLPYGGLPPPVQPLADKAEATKAEERTSDREASEPREDSNDGPAPKRRRLRKHTYADREVASQESTREPSEKPSEESGHPVIHDSVQLSREHAQGSAQEHGHEGSVNSGATSYSTKRPSGKMPMGGTLRGLLNEPIDEPNGEAASEVSNELSGESSDESFKEPNDDSGSDAISETARKFVRKPHKPRGRPSNQKLESSASPPLLTPEGPGQGIDDAQPANSPTTQTLSSHKQTPARSFAMPLKRPRGRPRKLKTLFESEAVDEPDVLFVGESSAPVSSFGILCIAPITLYQSRRGRPPKDKPDEDETKMELQWLPTAALLGLEDIETHGRVVRAAERGKRMTGVTSTRALSPPPTPSSSGSHLTREAKHTSNHRFAERDSYGEASVPRHLRNAAPDAESSSSQARGRGQESAARASAVANGAPNPDDGYPSQSSDDEPRSCHRDTGQCRCSECEVERGYRNNLMRTTARLKQSMRTANEMPDIVGIPLRYFLYCESKCRRKEQTSH